MVYTRMSSRVVYPTHGDVAFFHMIRKKTVKNIYLYTQLRRFMDVQITSVTSHANTKFCYCVIFLLKS